MDDADDGGGDGDDDDDDLRLSFLDIQTPHQPPGGPVSLSSKITVFLFLLCSLFIGFFIFFKPKNCIIGDCDCYQNNVLVGALRIKK